MKYQIYILKNQGKGVIANAQVEKIEDTFVKIIENNTTATLVAPQAASLLKFIEIPANFLEDGDLIEYGFRLVSVGLHIGCTIYLNDTNTLNGSETLLLEDYTSFSNSNVFIKSNIKLKGTTIKNFIESVYKLSGGYGANERTGVNIAQPLYLILELFQTNATISCTNTIIKKVN